MIFPAQIIDDTAYPAEAFYFSVFPRMGKRGEQNCPLFVGLQQRFGNGGNGAEVAVNLKWRVVIKKIR